MRLLQGRYGPYVSDGVTNASLPRGTTLEEVTLEYALNLLKERAAAGPAKPSPRKRAAKATPRKKTSPRKKTTPADSKPAAAKRRKRVNAT